MKYLVTSHELNADGLPVIKEEIEGALKLANPHLVFSADDKYNNIVAVFDATKFWVKEIK